MKKLQGVCQSLSKGIRLWAFRQNGGRRSGAGLIDQSLAPRRRASKPSVGFVAESSAAVRGSAGNLARTCRKAASAIH